MSQENVYLDMAVNVAFNYLTVNNKMLIVNDKDDDFFHTFFNKYKVCHISLIGSPFESLPYTKSFSVTNLGPTAREVYEDGALNSPVDVLYIDLGKNRKYENYFDDVIGDNTITIIRFSIPIVTGMFPDFIKRKYKNYSKDCLKFGDWDLPHLYNNSNYYLVFY